jgi:zinc protease
MDSLHRVQPPAFPIEKIVMPEVKSLTLNNGVPLYLLEAGTEEIVRLEFTFSAGQVKVYLPLLASTTNMMLSEGSQNYTSEELNRLLDYYGAFLNLSSEKDRAGIVVYLLNKHIEKIFELCLEILFRPVFPEEELNSLMKKRLSWHLVNKEKVNNLAKDKFFESVFGKHHPYGYQFEDQDFNNLTPALLTDFHKKNYAPENMAVIISGKIPTHTTELMNKYFGNISKEKIYNQDPENKLKGEKKNKVHINKTGTVQTAICIGSSTINKRHPDYPGLKILDSILGGYFGSRLMKNIREDKGYTYGISSAVSSLGLTGYKVIITEVNNENCRNTIDEIYKEIQLLQRESVTRKELEVVRNYMAGQILRMFDGPFALAESFRSAWEFGLDNSYYYRLIEKIKSIEPDEIKSLARTYYNIDELYQITVGSK